MRLYVFLAFLIVCIIAVNAAQQNPANKRNQLVKKKSTNGAVATNSNNLKAKPRARSSTKVRKVKKVKKVRKVKPSIGRKPKKVVRRVVKKSNRRPVAKKVARKSSRNTLRRGSRGGSRKRLAKQELSDSTENKSIGAGQANSGDVADTSADKPVDTVNQSAPKPAPAPAAAPAAAPAVAPNQPASDSSNPLSSPAQGASNPLSSSPFQIPKIQPGQNQAIGAAFSSSSNGGSAFASGFASIGQESKAGGYGQVNSNKQASNPSSETLNTAEEPAAPPAEEGSGDQLAAYRKRPRKG